MADKGKGKGEKGGDKGKKDAGKEKKEDKKEDKKDDKKAEKGGDKAAKGGDKPAKGGDKKDAKAPAAAPAAAGDKKDKKEEKKADKKAPAAAAAPSTDNADEANEDGADGEGGPRKRGPFRRFYYRGHEVPTLLDLSHAELMKLMTARARRRFARGHVPMNLIRRLRKAKKDAPEGDKPKTVKTHLRNMIIVPEMVASVVGVYNGQSFTQVEIKPDMIGHYLGEFSISYKPVKHGRPGVGATNSSRFIPLK